MAREDLVYLFLIFKNIYLFIYFWLHRVLVVAQGLVSSCGTQAPEQAGSVVGACGLSCPVTCGILVPRPGMEPTCPLLEGGFLTTGPPGKSLNSILSCFLSQFTITFT